jgi:regulator of protease activity HflC (stomatin/prohibitin superfamily)
MENKEIGILGLFGFVIVVGIIGGGLWGCPRYQVYSSRLSGEAELAQAQYTRQVAVLEANAKMDSAKLLADAEVQRAIGVAKANKIIGDSLKGNEGYLRYLWIQNLENQKKAQVIYVPTEAGLPILEAGKRH